jgi:hypothetical protein
MLRVRCHRRWIGGHTGQLVGQSVTDVPVMRLVCANHELNAVILGAEFGQQVQTMFERDLAASDAIELAAWKRRSPVLHVQEWFGRLWEYWL